MTEFFEIGYGKNQPRVKMGAEYRFVPLASKIVPSPLCKPGTGHGETPELSHLLPVPGGFSGELTVSLFSDGTRPFLFGQQKLVTDPPMPEPTPITKPASVPIGGKDTPVIPGKAARGMIKSVFRIATCSALEPVNKHHRFGDRDFEYLTLRGVKLRELSRGWLVPRKKAGSDGKGPTGYEWSIHPALSTSIDKVPFEKLASALTNEDSGGREHTKEMQFWQGRLRIGKKLQDCGIQKRRDKYKHLINSGFEGTLENGAYLIITGPMAKKAGEAVFGKPNEDRTLPGSNYREDMQRIMADFLYIHSDYSNDGATFSGGAKRTVTGNFRLFLIDHAKFVEDKCGRKDALALLRSHGLNEKDLGEAIRPKGMPGVPVYYTWDSDDALVFGTAQVFPVAHSFDVGDVHARRPKRNTDFDTTRFTDWTDGLFGTTNAWSEAGAGEKHQVPLASRVRFGFGTLKAGTPERMPRTAVVQGAPKASFQMYYLWETEPDTKKGLKGSWSSETAVLAGHKRYPAVRPYSGLGGKPFKGEKPEKTEALVQPLKGAATFDVPIRFDNLHPLELGALLWSVSFGDRQVFAEGGRTRYRHVGGRLRNKGLGRFEPRDARLRLRQNPMPEGLRLGDISGKIEDQVDALMLAFETFMGQRFRCAYPTDVISPNLADHEAFYKAPPITALLNMSDANWGSDRGDAKLDARFRLPETTANGGETKADFTAFMQLRRALYLKGGFPANSPYKRPINHVLDDFFDERPAPDSAQPDREDTTFGAFCALLDPLGALREWRASQA